MSAFRFDIAQRARPMEGLSACGDLVVDVSDGDWRLFAVIDALGHGPDAEKSAKAALNAIVTTAKKQPLSQVFESVHRALPGMRGVVMSALLAERGEFTFAGVGNVELFSPADVSRPVPVAGTLGSGTYRFRSSVLPLRAGQRWVLASDGIRARDASALLAKNREEKPQAVLEALFSSAMRAHDDASVLIIDVETAA